MPSSAVLGGAAARVPYPNCIQGMCSSSPISVCCGPDSLDGNVYCAEHCSCFNYTAPESSDGWYIKCPCQSGYTEQSQCSEQLSPTVWLAVILTGMCLLPSRVVPLSHVSVFHWCAPGVCRGGLHASVPPHWSLQPAHLPSTNTSHSSSFHPSCRHRLTGCCAALALLTVGTLLVLFIAWGFRCSDADDTTMDGETESRAQRHRAPLLREVPDRAAAAARPPTVRGDTEATTSSSLTGAGTGADNSLQRRTCCVCLSKPLQVVLIPCGHACVCRKCSRMLDTCPLCRLDIQATQRFYF